MNAHERALVARSPTFQDLCEAVRDARFAHNRAVEQRAAAERRAEALRQAEELAADAVEAARTALWKFIDRHTALEEELEGEAA